MRGRAPLPLSFYTPCSFNRFRMAHTLDAPGLAPFLPLLYVAWADGELTQPELDAFRDAIHRHSELDQGTLAALDDWLDPASPPDAADLEFLLERIHADREHYLAGNERVEDVAAALGMSYGETVRELLGETRPAPPHTFTGGDAALLQALLDGPEAATRQRMRAVLSRPQFAHRAGLTTAQHRQLVFDWIREVAREGFGSLGLPRELGGGGDVAGFLAGFETLGTHDASLAVKFGVQFGLFGGSIQLLGTERHHRYLKAAATLELPGCFAMSELGHGSNVRDIRTEARFDPATDEFIVHTPDDDARKDWIGNAAVHGRMATVFAQLYTGDTCHGVHALLVPLRGPAGEPLPGVRIADCGEKMGLNGVDNGKIWFDHVRVPRENLLNRYGDVARDGSYTSPIASPSARFFTMLGTLVGGRISVAKFALSAAKTGLTVAVRYSAVRRQFGPTGAAERPILEYQTHQRRLIPAIATTYVADLALKALTDRYLGSPGPEEQREIESDAAGLKAWVTWHVTRTLQDCRECCGGQGFLVVNRIGQLKSDSDIYTTFEGDNTVLMQLVAKGLLTEYRQQFGSMRLGGVIRYVARSARRRLSTLNPVIVRNTDEDHLRDPDEQEKLLRYRRDRLLGSVARRLKRRLDNGTDPFDAFRECQDHLLALGRAQVEVLMAREARAALARAPEGVQPLLRDLVDLHVLSCLERDAGWFQAAGAMEGNKAKAIRELVLRLAEELTEDAISLVQGFGIPDAILGAPIATGAPSTS